MAGGVPVADEALTFSGPVQEERRGQLTREQSTELIALAEAALAASGCSNSGRPGELAIEDVEVTDGDSGTTDAIFTVTLTGNPPQPVTVDFSTRDFQAIAPEDYHRTSGTLTFAVGETTQTIVVPVVGDIEVEPQELFLVDLLNPSSNATLGRGTAAGRIVDDDE